MPLITTTGSGSVRGLGRGRGRGGFDPFTLTLTAPQASRFGDDQATVDAFWATAPVQSSDVLREFGIQTYTGYYACTTNVSLRLSVTCGGAAGWRNTNGRSISASFSIPANTRIVFFAGKATTGNLGGQNQGAGGGASMLATFANGSFTPLVVAAGGSASFELRKAELGAQPLFVTSGTTPNFERNSFTSFAYPSSGPHGGVGRGRLNSAQSGGAGWLSAAFLNNGNVDDEGPQALSAGAVGGSRFQGGAADGGFGGGGGDWDGNSYGAGGGGYYGGFETAASGSPTGSYTAYNLASGDFLSTHCGPLSYVAPQALSFSDNGLHGSTADSADNSGQTGGLVQLLFEPE